MASAHLTSQVPSTDAGRRVVSGASPPALPAHHGMDEFSASLTTASPLSNHDLPRHHPLLTPATHATNMALPLVVLSSSSTVLMNTLQQQQQLGQPRLTPHPPRLRTSAAPRRTSANTASMRYSFATDTAVATSSATSSGLPSAKFNMVIPKDASRLLLLHPLDAQRQHQLAFSLQEREQEMEEMDKQARVAMLRRQQEHRARWAAASAAAVADVLSLWEAVGQAVRDRRTSLQPDGYQTFSFPDGSAVYEGYWKNCHPHGKGCLRRSSPLNEVYEGQWFAGQRCGTGTYHNSEFQMLYHGSWLDDKMHGKGELVEPEGVYTGEFVENSLHGHGEYVYNDGHVYKGDWVGGFYEGTGVYVYPSGAKYEGGWMRGCEHGRGTKWFRNGDVYNGEWVHGLAHGTGTFTSTCSTAARASGQWRYGSLYGHATCVFADGSHYTGEWQRGRFHGHGTYEVVSGQGEVQRYVGAFVEGKRHGYGEYVSSTVSYAGQWVRDKKEGEGSLQVAGGGTYVGYWRADVPDGEGIHVSTYRKEGCHEELRCVAEGGTFTACESQNTQQRVDLRMQGRE